MLNGLVNPCIWYYHEKYYEQNMGISDQYINALKRSFSKVWCASAFKGAAHPTTYCVPLLNRLKNQAFWVHKALTYNCFEGIILTGWSRFCHQLILCELFPVSIHSLSLCLKVVQSADLNLKKTYKELTKLGICGKNALKSHEEILMIEGKEGLIKAKLFEKNEGRRAETDLSWCEDCYEMSWELEKARILYKRLKKEIQQSIPLNYEAEPSKSNKRDGLFRKKSHDSVSQSEPSFLKDRRYNIKQKKEFLKTLHQCLAIVTREESRVDLILSKWLYLQDIEDFKNVTSFQYILECFDEIEKQYWASIR